MKLRKLLGELLLEQGAANQVQIDAALAHQKAWGQPLGDIVVDLRFCTPMQVLGALSAQTGIPTVDLDNEELPPQAAGLLPAALAERFHTVPLYADDRQGLIAVAIAAPASLDALDAIRAATDRRTVQPFLATDGALRRALKRLYGKAIAGAA